MKAKRRGLITAIVAAAAIFTVVFGAAVGSQLLKSYNSGRLSATHSLSAAQTGQTRVACVGDSITYGYGIEGWRKNAYPFVLADMLGDGYCVNNYGMTGATALNKSEMPYVTEKIFDKSLSFKPDIVIIMFGANDSRDVFWTGKESFKNDYSALVSRYEALETKPEIYLVASPAVEIDYDFNAQLLDGDIYSAVKELAAEKGLHFVDLNAVFKGSAGLLFDGIHPNANGARLFAETVFAAIGENTEK